MTRNAFGRLTTVRRNLRRLLVDLRTDSSSCVLFTAYRGESPPVWEAKSQLVASAATFPLFLLIDSQTGLPSFRSRQH